MDLRMIKVNENLKELCEHGTSAFPVTVSHDDFHQFENHCIRCHWHEDLEIVLMRKGSAIYQIGQETIFLRTGQCIVINSNVPHSAVPFKNSPAVTLTVIIRPVFLYGFFGSDIEQNCLQPFLRNADLPCIFLNPQEHASMLQLLDQVETAFRKRPFGFELNIKGLLCIFFFQLLDGHQKQLLDYRPVNQEHLYTLRAMLDYLHTHYPEQITLLNLSAAVHLSRESCCRLFRKMTGKTILQYLNEYRITQSIPLLLDGRFSIAQIAVSCGFGSSSRFAQSFRSYTGSSPREYQRQALLSKPRKV